VRILKVAARVFIWVVSAVVIASALIVLCTHAELVLIYGPQMALAFAWIAGGAIACGIVASFGVRRLGRRP
jgi:hypothetical protein